MSLDRLIKKIDETKNPTVAGLDPSLSFIPQYIKDASFKSLENPFEAAADAILTFNKGLIDALFDIVPAVKPQCAYYEMYGWQGMRALSETIKYAKQKGMFVITDGKRNDIGSTMECYATAHLGKTEINGQNLCAFEGDALTVNAYLGSDGITPLLETCEKYDKGIFVLCKTSNKSSGELQDKTVDGKTVYEFMGDMCEEWGNSSVGEYGYSGVGAVVGATYPQQLSDLRKRLAHTFFLVPGYGAQGGGAQDVMGAFDQNKSGAIINSSRAIMTAYIKEKADEKNYAQSARNEALSMKEALTAALFN